jgi:hypothetical protein
MFIKYKNAPIRIKYEDVANGLVNVPFPAITFNNELQIKYLDAKFVKFAVMLGLSVDDVMKKLKSDSVFVQGLLCDHDYTIRHKKFVEQDFPKTKKPEDFLSNIKESYQNKWFLNQSASWDLHYQPIFTESLTRRGYGFTFNMLHDSKLLREE